jgi:hypothetical protein
MIDLSLITHNITNELYATDHSRPTWSLVEGLVASHSKKLDYWESTLHPDFCFQEGQPESRPRNCSPFQISLALSYYSARIVLNRPCFNRRAFEDQSSLPKSRSDNMIALKCLRASQAIIEVLPDQPDLTWCYEVLGWWDLLHVLTQAIVVLLLHISIGPELSKSREITYPLESPDGFWTAVKKGLSWLHCLGRTSEAARRALQFFDSCIQRTAPSKGLDLRDIPSMIGLTPTSINSNFPWVRRPSDGTAVSLQQGIRAIDDRGFSEPKEFSNDALDGGIKDDTLCLDLQEVQSPWRIPGAATVLDADIPLSEVIPHPDAKIEVILLSMMDPLA